jgi:hypothetical protein
MANAVNDNLKIWNALAQTDPKHTKPVEQGQRKFTAIDAHWQVLRMTEHFGPVGIGWGYDVAHSTLEFEQPGEAPPIVLAVADVTMWTNNDSKGSDGYPNHYYFGPVRGTCEMRAQRRSGQWFTDEDAPKKAMTDAMTKAMSHLGVSADVFLGQFDDNRYVENARKTWEAKKSEDDPDLPESVRIVLGKIEEATTVAGLEQVLENARGGASAWTKPQQNLVALKAGEKRKKLGTAAIAAE